MKWKWLPEMRDQNTFKRNKDQVILHWVWQMMAQYELQLRRDTNLWTDQEKAKVEGERVEQLNTIF